MASEPIVRGEYATIGQVSEVSTHPASADECGTTIAEAIATFRRAIPQLFERHRGEWVAYRGGELLADFHSQTAVHQPLISRLRHPFGRSESSFPNRDLRACKTFN